MVLHKMHQFKVPSITGRGRVFSYMMFFYSMAMAFVAPVFPEYLRSMTGSESYVGLLIALASFVALIFGLLVSQVLHKIRRFTLLYSGFIGMAVVLFVFYLVGNPSLIVLLQVAKGFMAASIFAVIPLMVRDYTEDKSLSQEEGIYYWLINAAYVIGPILGGLAAYLLGVRSVFIIAMFIMFFAVWFLGHKHVVTVSMKKDEERMGFLKSIKKYFSRGPLVKAYLVDCGLYLWWSVATMCIPLYMAFNGFSALVIGLVVALKLLPLVLLERWVGSRVKDGQLGLNIRRGFLIIVLGLLALVLYQNVYFAILMFVVISFGAVFIEPVKETYLFRHLKKSEEDDLFPIYSTSRQLGFLVGPFVAGFVITFCGYQALFLLIALALLPMIYVGHLIYKE